MLYLNNNDKNTQIQNLKEKYIIFNLNFYLNINYLMSSIIEIEIINIKIIFFNLPNSLKYITVSGNTGVDNRFLNKVVKLNKSKYIILNNNKLKNISFPYKIQKIIILSTNFIQACRPKVKYYHKFYDNNGSFS